MVMSPAEYIELIQSTRADVASFVMNFMTLLFAFLTMAYLVGKKLSALQIVVVSILYLFLSYYLLSSIYITYDVMYSLMAEFIESYPEIGNRHYGGRGKGRDQISIMLAVCWVLSVVFLINVKTSKNENGI